MIYPKLMTQSKKIPRIQTISKVEGYRVYCVFNTGESGVVDFEKLFKEWDVKRGDFEYIFLLDLKEFQKVKLRDGVLSWENASVRVFNDEVDRLKVSNAPYEIDPITLYQHAEILPDLQDRSSVLDMQDDILIKLAHLKDEDQLRRLLFFLNHELHEEKN